jgi:hypothetical protein
LFFRVSVVRETRPELSTDRCCAGSWQPHDDAPRQAVD